MPKTSVQQSACVAATRTPIKPQQHLLPMCFVCGPDRAPGDGLRLFAGPLARQDTVIFAVPWTPDSSLAAADDLVAPEFVRSVLDCPTGYVRRAAASGRAMRGDILANRQRRPRRRSLVKKRTCLRSAVPSGLSSIGRSSSERRRQLWSSGRPDRGGRMVF